MALFSSIQATAKLTDLQIRKIERSQGGYEFKTYNDYALAFGASAIAPGKWKGQDAAWLEIDRIKCWKRWRVAANKITSLQIGGRLKPFGQILSYYRILHSWVLGRNHETRWIYGAYYLVEDLYEAYEDGLTPGKCSSITPPALLQILRDLNFDIANYAITRFYELIFGKYRNFPLLKQAAYEFDRDFVITEQTTIARPVYTLNSKTDDGRNALIRMSEIYNLKNWVGIIKLLDLSGISIPVFSGYGYYDSDLADPKVDFGVSSRVLIPLAMLYPDAYFIKDEILKDRFNSTTFTRAFQKGMSKIIDPNNIPLSEPKEVFVYNVYRVTHRLIMNVFNVNFFNE